jgi:hypothetical protein
VPEIEPGTSGYVARNSDHYTTEAGTKKQSDEFNFSAFQPITTLILYEA